MEASSKPAAHWSFGSQSHPDEKITDLFLIHHPGRPFTRRYKLNQKEPYGPQRQKETQKQKSLPFIEPDAAGIDIGATEIYVAVPEEQDIRPVRKLPKAC